MTGQADAMRILIADDHSLLRDTLQVFLDGEGSFETITVASYAEAETLVAEGPAFDLVLLDYTMPGMNGLELQEQLRSRGDLIPILILTGQADVNTVLRAWRSEASEFLQKSISNRTAPGRTMVSLFSSMT